MWYCNNCKTQFEDPATVEEHNGEWNGAPYIERFAVCPHCGDESIEEMDLCPCCGWNYKRDDQKICGDCEEDLIKGFDDFLARFGANYDKKASQIREWLEEVL